MKMHQVSFLMLLSLGCAPGLLKASDWTDRMTVTVCEALENPRVDGRSPRGRFLTTDFLGQVVEYCWEASALDPSWGGREETATKLLSSVYNESGFVAESLNYNHNHTQDVGLLQVNSIHWKLPALKDSAFAGFCRAHHLKPDLVTLWSPRTNILFGAFINEMMLREGGRPYKFRDASRPDCALFYDLLRSGSRQLASAEGRPAGSWSRWFFGRDLFPASSPVVLADSRLTGSLK
jgi:hypothetical protein